MITAPRPLALCLFVLAATACEGTVYAPDEAGQAPSPTLSDPGAPYGEPCRIDDDCQVDLECSGLVCMPPLHYCAALDRFYPTDDPCTIRLSPSVPDPAEGDHEVFVDDWRVHRNPTNGWSWVDELFIRLNGSSCELYLEVLDDPAVPTFRKIHGEVCTAE